MKKFKICLVCSAGGHLNQIKELIGPLESLCELYLVTLDRKDSRTLLNNRIRHYFIRDIRDNGNVFSNFADSLKIFRKEKPDFVITTGAGAALATCILAKLYFRKVIFIESFARVQEASAFGKVMKHIANHVLFQWPKLSRFYKKGIYAGSVFNIAWNNTATKKNQVFVTVGSTGFGFPRLLSEIDDLIESGVIKQKVIAQTGVNDYVPKNYEYFKWCDFSTMQKLLGESAYVITHSGTGSIVNALQAGARVVAVPRLQRYNEHLDNHQLEIAYEFQQMGLILVAGEGELKKTVKAIGTFNPEGKLSNGKFFDVLSGVINQHADIKVVS